MVKEISNKVRAKVLWNAGHRTPKSMKRRGNMWGWLKNEVNKDMPTTINALKNCIKKHWKKLDSDFLALYFDGMPDRMSEVIQRDGDKINY